MKPPELFGVIVRTTGFLIVIYSVWNVWTGVDNVVENILQTSSDSDAGSYSTFSYFAFGVPGLVFGAICFFFADWIVKLAYRISSE